jgi:ABC-type antimicrobial peptide transport system permease subunit
VTGIVRSVESDRPVDNVNTLSDLRADDIAPERLNAALFSSFAVLALLIASIGVLGVLAFTVSQRTREFGVRMALGARQSQVLGMVLMEGVLLATAAVVVGVIAAAYLSRFLSDLLYGVTSTDPGTFVGVAAALGVVAVAAAYLPATRATRVDPMEALRSE